MIKCSTEAYAKCQEHCHHCKTPDEAYFLEGSDCDKFNQQINHQPLTNADSIRAMSDEELAEWALYKAPDIGREYNHSLLGLIAWLKQPAEGDVNNG